MFGRNGKISGRQIRRMLLSAQAAKVGLLLPILAGTQEGGFSVSSFLVMAVLTLGFLKIMLNFTKTRAFQMMAEEERRNKGLQVFWLVLFWIYGFTNAALLLQMFAETAQMFLLTEQKIWVLILLAAVACSFPAEHTLEVRAKFQEVLFPLLIFPVLFLIFILAFLEIGNRAGETAKEVMRCSGTGRGVWMVTVFADLGLDVFLMAKSEDRDREESIFRTTVYMLIGSGFLLFLLQTVFGAKGVGALSWPLISAMSNSRIRGIFLQRWDALFALWFLGILCSALVSGFARLGICTEQLLPGKEKRWKWWAAMAAAVLAACGRQSFDRSVRWYEIISIIFLLISAAVAECVGIDEKTQRKKKERRENL